MWAISSSSMFLELGSIASMSMSMLEGKLEGMEWSRIPDSFSTSTHSFLGGEELHAFLFHPTMLSLCLLIAIRATTHSVQLGLCCISEPPEGTGIIALETPI